jgi:hypothetical protein
MRPRDTGLPHPADGCPRCLGLFAVVPHHAEADSPDGVCCSYRCPRCMHSWRTSWLVTGMTGVAHYYPDCHDGAGCSCGCGVLLLRPPARTASERGDAA